MNEVLLALIGGSVGAAVVSGAFGLITWRLNRGAAKADKAEAKDAAQEERIDDLLTGIRLMFYCELRRECKHHLAVGHISTEDLEEVLDMHEFYHDELKGNGFLDALISKVKKLKIIDDCECKEV